MNSAIANAYFRRIQAGKITLMDVVENKNIQTSVKDEVVRLVEEANQPSPEPEYAPDDFEIEEEVEDDVLDEEVV